MSTELTRYAQATALDSQIAQAEAQIAALDSQISLAEATPENVGEWIVIAAARERRTAEAASLTRALASRAALEPALYAARLAFLTADLDALKADIEPTIARLAAPVVEALRTMYADAAREGDDLHSRFMALAARSTELSRDDRFEVSYRTSEIRQLLGNVGASALASAQQQVPHYVAQPEPVVVPVVAVPVVAPKPTGNLVTDAINRFQARRDASPASPLRPRKRSA